METLVITGAVHEPINEPEAPRRSGFGRRRVVTRGQRVIHCTRRVSVSTRIAEQRCGVSAAVLLTVAETASLLRTTRKGVYAMVERRQISGVTRIGRRVLFRRDDLLDWLDQKRAPSPQE